MNFGQALEALKKGRRVCRRGWNGKGMWIEIHTPVAQRFLPYLEMKTVSGDFVPWLASQTDILAEDWEEVN